MYSKTAEEEDTKMADRWQKDADGVLIFVSPRVSIRISLCIIRNNLDWFILRSRCSATFRVTPEPHPQRSGHLILSPKHLWDSRRPECNTRIHFTPSRYTTHIFSSEICHLG